MREINFRGKRVEDGSWEYGSLIESNGSTLISNKSPKAESQWAFTYEISPDTVSQYTGFKDKNGIEIYEGDILSYRYESDGEQNQSKNQVFWCEKTGAWRLDHSFGQDKSLADLLSDELHSESHEVTGNIYEENNR